MRTSREARRRNTVLARERKGISPGRGPGPYLRGTGPPGFPSHRWRNGGWGQGAGLDPGLTHWIPSMASDLPPPQPPPEGWNLSRMRTIWRLLV